MILKLTRYCTGFSCSCGIYNSSSGSRLVVTVDVVFSSGHCCCFHHSKVCLKLEEVREAQQVYLTKKTEKLI